jgi:hypothetical protein
LQSSVLVSRLSSIEAAAVLELSELLDAEVEDQVQLRSFVEAIMHVEDREGTDHFVEHVQHALDAEHTQYSLMQMQMQQNAMLQMETQRRATKLME